MSRHRRTAPWRWSLLFLAGCTTAQPQPGPTADASTEGGAEAAGPAGAAAETAASILGCSAPEVDCRHDAPPKMSCRCRNPSGANPERWVTIGRDGADPVRVERFGMRASDEPRTLAPVQDDFFRQLELDARTRGLSIGALETVTVSTRASGAQSLTLSFATEGASTRVFYDGEGAYEGHERD